MVQRTLLFPHRFHFAQADTRLLPRGARRPAQHARLRQPLVAARWQRRRPPCRRWDPPRAVVCTTVRAARRHPRRRRSSLDHLSLHDIQCCQSTAAAAVCSALPAAAVVPQCYHSNHQLRFFTVTGVGQVTVAAVAAAIAVGTVAVTVSRGVGFTAAVRMVRRVLGGSLVVGAGVAV